MFFDRLVWTNSADPDQTTLSNLIRVYAVCFSGLAFCWHYSMVKLFKLSRIMRKPVFGVSDEVQHKPGFHDTAHFRVMASIEQQFVKTFNSG